jgi:pimeloyl-ACP methyl ester carboxylesterase
MSRMEASVLKFIRLSLTWLAKAAAAAAALVVTLVAILLLVMWWEHQTVITLPTPTGRVAVGRITYVWTNESEAEDLALSPGSKRQVLVWVWYPAATSPADAPTAYLPGLWRAALAEQEGMFMRSFFKRDPALVHTHSVSGAMVSPEQRTYPVVLLRAGGSALTTDFTTLAEDLASHGFFVVGFDAPYRSFVVVLPDGRVVGRSPAYHVENANGNLADPVIGKLLQMWTADTAFVVDQLQRLNADTSENFAGRMDLQRLGMFGHSFGGATALEFCHQDSRCKAALDMDGIPFGRVVPEGLNKPGMFLLSDHSRETAEPAGRQVRAEIQSIYERLPNGRLYVVIRTANHFSFSDQILLNSQAATKLLRLVVGFGGLDGRRGLAISADYVHTFFDVYLNHAPAVALVSIARKYKEVQIEGR